MNETPEWYTVSGGQSTLLGGKRIHAERLTESVMPQWLEEVTGDNHVCPHSHIQYRVKTKQEGFAYMCANCYRDILKDPNTSGAVMGFRQIYSIKLREYLEGTLDK